MISSSTVPLLPADGLEVGTTKVACGAMDVDMLDVDGKEVDSDAVAGANDEEVGIDPLVDVKAVLTVHVEVELAFSNLPSASTKAELGESC